MKKIILRTGLLLVFAAFIQGTFLFAQDAQEPAPRFSESEYYYYNVPIEKIYAHRLGYMVVYRSNSNRTVRTFMPLAWFNTIGEGTKGEVIGLPPGNDWPSMTVYYKSGVFSHVRLMLRQNRLHETWGTIPLSADYDEYFQNVEEVKLEF